MSTFSQFAGGGGGIKSIQRGAISIVGGPAVNSATATITAVNPAKTELRLLGFNGPNDPATAVGCRVELTNSTTVTAHRSSSSPYSCTHNVNWELTEWN